MRKAQKKRWKMMSRGKGQKEVEDGADLLPTEEDNTHGQYIGKEREVLEQDHHRIQIPIHFAENKDR